MLTLDRRRGFLEPVYNVVGCDAFGNYVGVALEESLQRGEGSRPAEVLDIADSDQKLRLSIRLWCRWRHWHGGRRFIACYGRRPAPEDDEDSSPISVLQRCRQAMDQDLPWVD